MIGQIDPRSINLEHLHSPYINLHSSLLFPNFDPYLTTLTETEVLRYFSDE